MKKEHIRILVECHRRSKELADKPRPYGYDWRATDYDEQVEHGPAYGCGKWFGPHRNTSECGYVEPSTS